MDQTYVRVAGRWMYLFRAVDSRSETVDFYLSERRDRESAKAFLEKALSNPDNPPPWVLCMDKSPIYPAAIRELKAKEGWTSIAGFAAGATATIGLNPITGRLSGDCGPCKARGPCGQHAE